MVVVAVLIAGVSIQNANANPAILAVGSLSSAGQGLSSSTLTYLVTTSATTTMVVPMYGADQLDLNVGFLASTTGSILLFSVDYTSDLNCSVTPSACNWYREDAKSTSGAISTHVNAYHTWTPGIVSTSTKNFNITTTADTRFIRIGLQTVAANSGIWIQTVAKNQVK